MRGRLGFVGTGAGFDPDGEVPACGVEGDGHQLIFQRDPEAADEDWGVYLEFDDQSGGGYDAVRSCRLARRLLTVDLARPLDRPAGVEGFDVTLDLDDAAFAALKAGLERVFRGRAEFVSVP